MKKPEVLGGQMALLQLQLPNDVAQCAVRKLKLINPGSEVDGCGCQCDGRFDLCQDVAMGRVQGIPTPSSLPCVACAS